MSHGADSPHTHTHAPPAEQQPHGQQRGTVRRRVMVIDSDDSSQGEVGMEEIPAAGRLHPRHTAPRMTKEERRRERMWRRDRMGVWDRPRRGKKWWEILLILMVGAAILVGGGWLLRPQHDDSDHHYYNKGALGCSLYITHGSHSVTNSIINYVRSWGCGIFLGNPSQEADDLADIVHSLLPEKVSSFRSLRTVRTEARRTREATEAKGGERGSPYGVSPEEFYRLAEAEQPLLFKGMWEDFFPPVEGGGGEGSGGGGSLPPWDAAFFREICGRKAAVPHVYSKNHSGAAWAGMVPHPRGTASIAELIDEMGSSTAYLHDWALPVNCPEVFEEGFTMPRYFANDFLQSVDHSSHYRDEWPSLFIGPKGSQTGVHVDNLGSHAWLLLLSGKKVWRTVRSNYSALMYSTPHSYDLDLFDPDFEKHRMASLVDVQEAVMEAGDVIFVPGGTLHQVKNLEASVAITSNYIDGSSFPTSLKALREASTHNEQVYYFLKELERLKQKNDSLPHVAPHDMPWEEFKAQRIRKRPVLRLVEGPNAMGYALVFMATVLILVIYSAWALWQDLAPGC